MNDIIAFFAFLKYCLGYKGDMSKIVARMNWMGKAQQIHRQNMKVNAVAGKLFTMLRENEFRCCVLKGQGILLFLLLLSMWCISCAGYVLVKYCF